MTRLVGLFVSVVVFLLCLLVAEIAVRAFVDVRNVGPSFTRYDPKYGKRLKENISVTRIAPEFTMRFTTNSLGFRGPEIGSLENGSILFLGDSFTMGYGVSDGQEYPAIVRDKLSKLTPSLDLEVINTGMGDSGLAWPLMFLRDMANEWNPKIVVLQINQTDFTDNINDNQFYLAPSGELARHKPRPKYIERRLQNLVERIPGLSYSYLISLARQVPWDIKTSTRVPSDQPMERLMLSLLSEIVQETMNLGCPLLVVLPDPSMRRRVLLEDFFTQRDIPTIIIPSKLERPDLYFEVDGHWNPAGHVFTASRILQTLPRLVE